MSLDHLLGARRHGQREHEEQRDRDGTHGRRDGVDDDILAGVELVGPQDDDAAHERKGEKVEEELCELSGEGRADGETEEHAQPVNDGFEEGFDRGPCGGLLLLPDLVVARAAQCPSDETDLGEHARRKDNAPPATLGDDGRAIHHVQPIPRPRIIIKRRTRHLQHRLRLARQQRLVGLEVNRLDESNVRGDRVTRLQVDNVARDHVRRLDRQGLAAAEDFAVGRAEGFERLHRLLGGEALEEADDDVEKDDAAEDTAFDPSFDAETGCERK